MFLPGRGLPHASQMCCDNMKHITFKWMGDVGISSFTGRPNKKRNLRGIDMMRMS